MAQRINQKTEEYNTDEVFTPSSPATTTFIERNKAINNHLVDSLRTRGKQIVLYGHSGCGKSTLLINKLNQLYENTITTHCSTGMSFESVLLDAFDQLGKIYKDSSVTRGYKINPSLSVEYNDIKASLSFGEFSKETKSTSSKILPPQLTAQRLAHFFGESNSCWVLEDFHKIVGEDKVKISQLMKIFMDLSKDYKFLKLIALGAVNTAREVIIYDSEMNNRVAEIYIPYMSNSEIESIITTGQKLLNLWIPKDVKRRIVKYSCGLPSVCHQLCLNICFNRRIYSTAKDLTTIEATDLEEAIEKYLIEKSDTLKAEFDKAVRSTKNTKENPYKEILRIALQLEKDEFSSAELIEPLQNKIKVKTIERNLEELCSISRNEILIYDENSELYRFNNLFLKAYTTLQFKDDPEEQKPQIPKRRDERVVQKLLEIIERDINHDFDDLYLEDDY